MSLKHGTPKPTTTPTPEAKTPAVGENVVQTVHGLKDEPISLGLRSSAAPPTPAAVKNYGALTADKPAVDLLKEFERKEPLYSLDHFSFVDPRLPLEAVISQQRVLEDKWNAHFAGTDLEGAWVHQDVPDSDDSWRLTELMELRDNLEKDPDWFSREPESEVQRWERDIKRF